MTKTETVDVEQACDDVWEAMRPMGGAFWHEIDERARTLAMECYKAGAAARTQSPAEWEEFTERHRTHFPHPDGTEVEVHGYDTGYCQAFQTVMQVGSPQWKGHARFIAGWRLPAPERSKEETGVRVWPPGTAMKQTPATQIEPDSLGHRTRFSDSSMYDEVCVLCGATDGRGDNRLSEACPKALETPPLHKKGEAKPSWFAVQSVSGAHVGMWRDERIARRVFNEEYPDGRFIPLYAAAVPVPVTITDEEVRNGARGIWDAGETGLPFEMAPPSLVRGLMNQSRACLTAALSQKPGEQG